jgi:hypothetical protein
VPAVVRGEPASTSAVDELGIRGRLDGLREIDSLALGQKRARRISLR